MRLEDTAWDEKLVHPLKEIDGVSCNPEADGVVESGHKSRTTISNYT
jgi:hypothetical protein